MGVDPGVTGAAALYQDGVPIKWVQWGEDRHPIIHFFKCIRKENLLVIIENVYSSPQQGVTSAFTFGENKGVWRGIMEGLEIPYKLVTPRRWQKAVFQAEENIANRKAFTVKFVNTLFPYLKLKSTQHGIADAVCMALYGRYHDE